MSLTNKIKNAPTKLKILCIGYCNQMQQSLSLMNIPAAVKYIIIAFCVQGDYELIHIGKGDKRDIEIFGKHNNCIKWLKNKRNIILGPSKLIKQNQKVHWDLTFLNDLNKEIKFEGNQLYITIFKNFHEISYLIPIERWRITKKLRHKKKDTFQNIFLRDNNSNIQYWGVNNLNQRYSHQESIFSLQYTHWGPYDEDHNIRIQLDSHKNKISFTVVSNKQPYVNKKGGKITSWTGVKLNGLYSLVICGRTKGLKIELQEFASLK